MELEGPVGMSLPSGNGSSIPAVVLLIPLKRPICVLIVNSYFTIMVGNCPTFVIR